MSCGCNHGWHTINQQCLQGNNNASVSHKMLHDTLLSQNITQQTCEKNIKKYKKNKTEHTILAKNTFKIWAEEQDQGEFQVETILR